MKLSPKQRIFALIIIISSPSIGIISAHAASTQLTLTVTSNVPPAALTISAPASLSLGTNVSFPSTFTTTFASPVAVTDTRVAALGWTSQVLISELTPASGPAIPSSVFSYDTGHVTQSGGGTLLSTAALTPGVTSTVVLATGVVTSAAWWPTLTLTEPGAPATGTYTGTVTSSVF